MPVTIWQTCLSCHVTKDRDREFPSRVVGRSKRGGVRRVWLTYCLDCIDHNPALLSDPERLPNGWQPQRRSGRSEER